MITQIGLNNVRLFEDKGWDFHISPLTIFCGTNSSGKSTILKVLLLLRQSQGIDENFAPEPGRLQFVGSQVDLGDYTSFISQNDTRRNMLIRVVTQVRPPKRSDDKQPALREVTSVFMFGPEDEDLTGAEQEPIRRADLIPAKYAQKMLSGAVFALTKNDHPAFSIVVTRQVDERNSLRYYVSLPDESYEFRDDYDADIVKEDNGEVTYELYLDGLLPHPTGLESYDYFGDLAAMLRRLQYVGPLRLPAKRQYVTNQEAPSPLDPAGEFLAKALQSQGLKMLLYASPPGQPFNPIEGTLGEAINSWMFYIRTGEAPLGSAPTDEIILDAIKNVVELKAKTVTGTGIYPLADLGVGYSQILPILVKCLLAEPDSTVIIEQPELHLHPALQVRLAEFFVAMMRLGKQLLIETHSEHIVNMIRVLAAEDTTGKLASLSKIYYIDAGLGRPEVHEMSIGPDGMVPNWPQDFFGEAASLTGRLLRAQKRFIRRSKKGE